MLTIYCCIMALGPSVQYDIQFIGGVKNTLFGGEGLFIATVIGPGPIWLQSLPFSRLTCSWARTTNRIALECPRVYLGGYLPSL